MKASMQHSPSFMRRLYFWLTSSTDNKVFSILVRLLRFSRRYDGQVARQAYFETLAGVQKYAITTNGSETFVLISADKAISKLLYVDGSFDLEKIEKTLSILGRTIAGFKLRTLIDIGANIGTVCIPIVKRGIAERAIAIEPEQQNFRVLMANIYLNDLTGRIETHNVALGSANDEVLEIELSESNSGDHRIRTTDAVGSYGEEKRERAFVKSETLDKMVPLNDRTSSLIWMDTQGYEGLILKGAKQAIEARMPLVTEFWPYGISRTNSYPQLRAALVQYEYYYDLSDDDPTPVRATESAIDTLFRKLEEKNSWTDILLI